MTGGLANMQPQDAVRAACRSISEASLQMQVDVALANPNTSEIAPLLQRLAQVMKLSHSPTRTKLLQEELKALQGLLLRERLREVGEIAAKAESASQEARERGLRLRQAQERGHRHLEVNAAGKHLEAVYLDVDGAVLKSYSGPKTGAALVEFLLQCDGSGNLLKQLTREVRNRAK